MQWAFGSTIIFRLNKQWKAKFFILCDVILLVRLQGKFEIDQSWEWRVKRRAREEGTVTCLAHSSAKGDASGKSNQDNKVSGQTWPINCINEDAISSSLNVSGVALTQISTYFIYSAHKNVAVRKIMDWGDACSIRKKRESVSTRLKPHTRQTITRVLWKKSAHRSRKTSVFRWIVWWW